MSILNGFSIPTFLHVAAGSYEQGLFVRRILLELLTTNTDEIVDIYLSPLTFTLLDGTALFRNQPRVLARTI